ncbi:helix-turn-helix domain-containing protein [Sporosalibacterium faouarense]|uniref:helix-turn-helix domain-containing protein n=1 Tax=Sporosalibacterium faouarense TaxID=516123 RepID=UPI00192B9959|nr:helix-turn-helix transcriptional regulator [Sporosalibacterium faouarense]
MEFGERISQLRKEKSMTQEELSKLLGVSRGAIGMYEIDKRDPDTNTLKKISNIFNVSVDYLLGKNNERKGFSKAYHTLDVEGLSEEDIRKVEEYIELIKMKYNSDGSLKKK